MYHIGQLTVAAGTSVSNLSTAVPFNIPQGLDSILVLASGADCYAELNLTAATFTTSASAGVSVGVTAFQVPMPSGNPNPSGVLSVFNNNASSRTVDVWAIYA